MVHRFCRMSPKQTFFSFVCLCGLAGMFYYYTLFRNSSFTIPGKPYMAVNGVVSLTGFLSLNQQQLEQDNQDRIRLLQAESLKTHASQKAAAFSLELHNKPTSSRDKVLETSEDLEKYTISRPSRDKVYKFVSDEQLNEKFLRNDERSIERIVNGETNQSTEEDEVFRKQGQPKKRFPTVIVIGVKKGGTRALLEMLKLHPRVCACGPEMHFFDRYYTKGLKWYRDKMPLCYQNEASVEKTPSYFVTSRVAKDMFEYSKSLNRTLKLLVIVRDPTTRAISDYTQTRYKLQMRRISRKIAAFEDLAVQKTENGTKSVNDQWGAIKIGLYSKHLKRWRSYFPSEQIHVVSGESLIKEPYAEIKKVEQFLELPSFIKPEHFVYNETKKFYCFDRNLSQKTKKFTIPLRCLGTSKGRSHVKISNDTDKLLRDYFRPFNEELYKMVGRNFGWL